MTTSLLRFLVLLPFLGSFFQSQQAAGFVISQPVQGEVVRGVVQVNGTAAGEGFGSFELVYSFENSNAPNWFTIATANKPVDGGYLGSWDTTTITDGDYSVKLIVHLQDGSQQEAIVQHVLVRNYTAADGSAGSVASPTAASNESQGGFADSQPGVPANPAALPQGELMDSVYLGLKIGLGVIVLIGVYAWLRRISRR